MSAIRTPYDDVSCKFDEPAVAGRVVAGGRTPKAANDTRKEAQFGASQSLPRSKLSAMSFTVAIEPGLYLPGGEWGSEFEPLAKNVLSSTDIHKQVQGSTLPSPALSSPLEANSETTFQSIAAIYPTDARSRSGCQNPTL